MGKVRAMGQSRGIQMFSIGSAEREPPRVLAAGSPAGLPPGSCVGALSKVDNAGKRHPSIAHDVCTLKLGEHPGERIRFSSCGGDHLLPELCFSNSVRKYRLSFHM